MYYFDSDVIFNCIAKQDLVKHSEATELIANAIFEDSFMISTLVLSEVGYGLSRYEMPVEKIKNELDFYNKTNTVSVVQTHLPRAFELASITGFKHVNDCVHTAVAEHLGCRVLYTYNKSDFKRIQKHAKLEIRIL